MTLVDLPAISAPLPWHAPVWEQLSTQVAAEQLPHALLFAGEQGCGVPRLALALARMLLCVSPEGAFNCGEC
ncbi:MAG: DNA polymerase III subunit delta', partial [Halieaceae bacterium]|nr:DNA polymerase III subunit delta' [Halieaceae bacterium]